MIWEKVIPAILSGILPGVGQIYNREFLKGLDLLLLQGVLVFLVFFPIGEVFAAVGSLVIPLVWVYSVADSGGIFDVLHSRRRELNYHRALIVIICVGIIVEVGLGSLIWKLRPHNFRDEQPLDISQPTIISNPRSTDTESPSEIVNSETDVSFSSPTDMELSSEAKESSIISTARPSFSPSTATELDISQSLHQKEETHQVSPPEQYIITVETFHSKSNAEELKARLIDNGESVKIIKNQKFYMVSVIGGKTVEVAKAAQRRLATQFPDCYVAVMDAPAVPIFR